MREATELEILRVLHTFWMKPSDNDFLPPTSGDIVNILSNLNLNLTELNKNCIIAESLDGKTIFTIKS